MARWLFAGFAAVSLVVLFAWWPSPIRVSVVDNEEPVRVADLLGEETEGFKRALTPRPFAFPADHGAHPEYRHEWWYVTGNLETPSGRPYGYQFTLFRFALTPEPPQRSTAWAAQSVYLGHLAVTDIEAMRFHTRQKLSRGGALGLAGASVEPVIIWLEDWQIQGKEATHWPLRIQAQTNDLGIDITLHPEKPVVLQGDRGLSRKGPQPGNASYYYSVPRLDTRGTLTIDGAVTTITGRSWMDREWGSSVLGEGVAGWDWFALHLADGRDVMFYHLRREDGSGDALSRGVVIDSSGEVQPLRADEVSLTVTSRWESPVTGIAYPVGWQLEIPTMKLTLEVRSRILAQEWTEPIRYWEGAVSVSGSVDGVGYLEMTGYDKRKSNKVWNR